MTLDYTSLANAINQLEKSLKFSNSSMAQADSELFEQLRNSVIQCFEFTYELTHKMLKRSLEQSAASAAETDFSTFQNLIRTGNEKNLLRSDWIVWKTYRQAKNNSRQAYDESKATAVYDIAPDFLLEAKHLYQQLLNRSFDE